MHLPHLLVVAFAIVVIQADVIRSHFASAVGTPERPAASVVWIARGDTRPSLASTNAVPSVGWPANGISSSGVKIRIR